MVIAGTTATFFMDGEILVHGSQFIAHAIEGPIAKWGWMKVAASTLTDALAGEVAGAICLAAWTIL
jgi:predicted DNA repair protein MutK